MTLPLMLLENVERLYGGASSAGGERAGIGGVNLRIEAGEFVVVMGHSGSGKSILMNVLGCLDRPTAGRYLLEGRDTSELGRNELARLRNEKIGFVFQGFNLLARTTAEENVELPLLYAGLGGRERRRRSREALESVGLGGRERKHPVELSGGEQQRVAIARALVGRAPLLLADEPTGNLDSRTSHDIMRLIEELNLRAGLTIVLVTHEADIAAWGKRIVTMLDGRIVSDEARSEGVAT